MSGSLKVAMTVEQCWHRVPGGTAVAAIGMARGLLETGGIELVGVAARHSSGPPEPWTLPMEVRHLPLPRLALYEAWHRLRLPAVQRATGPVAVLHATSLAIPPRTAPLVVTVHDLAFLNDRSHFTKRGLSFFARGLELTLSDADLVVCPSDATLEHCVEAGFPRERLRMIPMGVPMERAAQDETEHVKRRYGLERPYVMWTGTIEPRKNLGRLLEAFGRRRDGVDLVLVGPRGWNEDIEPLARRLGDRVKVLGFVPHSDLRGLYAGAELFCFPSLFEGFGLPVLEAMVQGTPVVTSRGTSTEELGQDAAVLIDPHDVSSIEEGIGRVLDDAGFAASLSRAGVERAAAYPWSRTGAALADAYREVAT